MLVTLFCVPWQARLLPPVLPECRDVSSRAVPRCHWLTPSNAVVLCVVHSRSLCCFLLGFTDLIESVSL